MINYINTLNYKSNDNTNNNTNNNPNIINTFDIFNKHKFDDNIVHHIYVCL